MLSKFVSLEMLFLADRHIFDTYLNIWATCTIMVGFHTFMDDGKCVVGVGFHFNIAQLQGTNCCSIKISFGGPL